MSAAPDPREALLSLLLKESEPAPETRTSALSFSQRRIWFVRQLLGDRDASYNVPFAMRLRGSLDRSALAFAVNEIIARHDVLRARFDLEDGQPVQRIAQALHVEIAFLEPDPQAVADIIADHARHAFDLSAAPLLKVSVLRLSADDHVLLLNMHHIIADGWSLACFVKEVSELYRSRLLGEPARLPQLQLQYADFAQAQARQVDSGRFEPQLRYWLKQLSNAPQAIALPTDRPRPEQMSGAGGQIRFVVPGDVRDGLKAIAAEAGATLFMVLMSAFLVLLHRLSGDEDINVGTPVAGRPNPDLEPLIGCFVNTVVLRSTVRREESFKALLEQVRQTSLDAFEHQDLPFELLVEHLRPQRSLGRTPVFQVMMALQNIPVSDFDLPDLTIEPIAQNLSIAKFDLNLNLSERASGISAVLEYNGDIFDASTAERLSTAFQEILSDLVVVGPSAAVSEFRLSALDALTSGESEGHGSAPPPKAGADDMAEWAALMEANPPPQPLPRTSPCRRTPGPPRPATLDLSLAPALAERVKRCARALGAEPADVVAAAWCGLNQRLLLDGQAVIGLCAAPEGELNTDPAQSTWSILRLKAGAGHSLASLVADLAGRGPGSRAPGLQGRSILQMRSSSASEHAPCPASVSNSVLAQTTPALLSISPFHLSLSLAEQKVSVRIGHDLNCFDEGDAQAILSLFLSWLDRLASEPSRPLETLGPLHGIDRKKALERCRGPLEATPVGATLAAPFEARAREHPDDVALICETRTYSYGALAKRARRIARLLQAHGVREGDRVALCLPRGVLMIETIYAVAMAGAVYVPLDADLPAGRMADMLGNIAASHLVAEAGAMAHLPQGRWRKIALDACEAEIEAQPDDPLTLSRGSRAAAYIMHTSGSSGAPKAVQFPTDVAIRSMQSLQTRYPVAPGDTHLFKTPYSFDVSIWEIFWPLYHGGALVVCAPDRDKDPQYLKEMIEAHRVAVINIVPSMLDALLQVLPDGACPSLRWVLSGGERLSPALRDLCFEKLPRARLANLYGPTETHAVADAELGRQNAGDSVPIGTASSSFRLYVLDDQLEPAPPGAPGELYVGHDGGVAHGYLGQPGLTAERFIPDPFGPPGSRLYRTGDLCRADKSGQLEYLGRRDRQLKLAGRRIEPGEIEQAILKQPSIDQCRVIGVGEGPTRRLVAFLVPGSRPGPDVDVLRRTLSEALPAHLVPGHFMTLPELPLTANGKLDEVRLEELWRSTVPPVAPAYAPATDAGACEARVRRIFKEVLNRSDIDPGTSFFELGGHSLMAIQVITRCQSEFAVTLPLQTIYKANSVRALAAAIEAARDAQTQSLVELAGAEAEHGAPVIVLIHGSEGAIAPLMPLARELGRHARVYAFEAPGLSDGRPPCPTIRAYGEYYAPLLAPLCERGDVTLVGWSFGGNIAVELTRLLARAEKPVDQTILLDSFVVDAVTHANARSKPALDALQAFEFPGLSAFLDGDEAGEVAERVRAVLDNNLRAFVEYAPEITEAPIHLLEAAQGWPGIPGPLAGPYGDGERGWSGRLRGLRRSTVAGDHFSMLAESHCASLAEEILILARSGKRKNAL